MVGIWLLPKVAWGAEAIDVHREYRWPPDVGAELAAVEQLRMEQVGQWISEHEARGDGLERLYLLLALASSRYVDHHGPYIGHGTFNGGPMLRASSILLPTYRNLALRQTVAYVIELIDNPNYGPYLLMDMSPYRPEHPSNPDREFLEALESGNQPLRTEHRLVAMLQDMGVQRVRTILTEAGLRQFRDNEHRLLIVHRAAQFLDDVCGWDSWGEPILRPSIQYLATAPKPALLNPGALSHVQATQGLANVDVVAKAVDRLISVPYGDEPEILREMAQRQISGINLYEAVSLTGSRLLAQSGFDAHAVTGIHCVLDILKSSEDPRLVGLAWSVALSGQRTRRQKERRNDWRRLPDADATVENLDDFVHVIRNDPSGLRAFARTAGALQSGTSAQMVARTLMEVSLTTSDPFTAIHNVKMIWGQLIETQRSECSELAWMHLAAGAVAVAQSVAENATQPIPVVDLWKETALSD